MTVQQMESKDEATITELRERLSTLEAQLRSISAENDTLTEEIQGLQARSLSTQESVGTLLEGLSSARERETQHNATIIELQAARAEDETTIADLRQHLSTLEARLRLTNAQNHNLTEENQAYKADSLAMQESIDTLSADLSSAREEITQHNTTIIGLKKARDEEVTEIAHLVQQLSTLETRLLSTSAESRTWAERYETDSLSKQESINTLSEDLSSAREEVAQHDATITNLKKAQAEDQSTIADLLQQLSTLRARLLSTDEENRALLEENKRYEAGSLSMKESIKTLSENLSSAREETTQHNATITDLKEAQAEDQAAITDLRQQLLSSSTLNGALAKENKGYEAKSLFMRESIDTLSKDLSSAREELALHESMITYLEEVQAEDQAAIIDLRQQLSTSRGQLLSKSTENRALAGKNKRHEATSLFMRESIDTLSRDLSSAREEVAQHKAEITRLKAARAKSESTIDKLQDHLTKLSKENSSMSARNAEENTTKFSDLHQRLEKATKAATYWHDLCTNEPKYNLPPQNAREKKPGDELGMA
ncbi:hypothetical protein H1R20_g6601, partial [Candolleomyces eurysporus]